MKMLNGKMRALKNSNKWWVSAADFIAALRNTDYDTARNYWKQYKYRLRKNRPGMYTYQLKMPAKDGRMRYTDVIDFAAMVAIIHHMSKTNRNIIYLPCIKAWEALLVDMSYVYKNFQKVYMARTYIKEFEIMPILNNLNRAVGFA